MHICVSVYVYTYVCVCMFICICVCVLDCKIIRITIQEPFSAGSTKGVWLSDLEPECNECNSRFFVKPEQSKTVCVCVCMCVTVCMSVTVCVCVSLYVCV